MTAKDRDIEISTEKLNDDSTPYEKVMAMIADSELDYSVVFGAGLALITVDVPENDNKEYDVDFISRFINTNAYLKTLSKATRSQPMQATFRCSR